MESNVVSFIIENIFLFLPLGIIGIGVTIYLYVTAEKVTSVSEENSEVDYLKFSRVTINFYVLVYLFICIMFLIIGYFSDFMIPVIVGSMAAFIPVVLMILIKWKADHTRMS